MRILYDTKDFVVDDNSTFRDLLRELTHDYGHLTIQIFITSDRVVRVRDLDDSFALHGLGPGSTVAAKDKPSTEPRLLGGMHNDDMERQDSGAAAEPQIAGDAAAAKLPSSERHSPRSLFVHTSLNTSTATSAVHPNTRKVPFGTPVEPGLPFPGRGSRSQLLEQPDTVRDGSALHAAEKTFHFTRGARHIMCGARRSV